MIQTEMFPATTLEKLKGIRGYLMGELDKKELALEAAENKVQEARTRVFAINEAIEAAGKSREADFDLDLETGEVTT